MNPLEYIRNALTNATDPNKFRLGMTSATTPVLTSALYDLKRSNVLPENARKYVPTFGDDAKMDALMSIKGRMARGENIGEAEKVFMDKYTRSNLENLAMEGTSNLKFDGGVVKRAMSKIDPLIEEARKYKSAEEFINKYTQESQIPVGATSLKRIPLNKITGSDYPELDEILQTGGNISKESLQNIISETDPFVKGKPVKNAIELIPNGDGTYSLMGGNHRVAQALLNKDKDILSYVEGEKGDINLTDIWNKAKGGIK